MLYVYCSAFFHKVLNSPLMTSRWWFSCSIFVQVKHKKFLLPPQPIFKVPVFLFIRKGCRKYFKLHIWMFYASVCSQFPSYSFVVKILPLEGSACCCFVAKEILMHLKISLTRSSRSYLVRSNGTIAGSPQGWIMGSLFPGDINGYKTRCTLSDM